VRVLLLYCLAMEDVMILMALDPSGDTDKAPLNLWVCFRDFWKVEWISLAHSSAALQQYVSKHYHGKTVKLVTGPSLGVLAAECIASACVSACVTSSDVPDAADHDTLKRIYVESFSKLLAPFPESATEISCAGDGPRH